MEYAKPGLTKVIGLMIAIYVIGILATTVYTLNMAVVTQGHLAKMREKMFNGMQDLLFTLIRALLFILPGSFPVQGLFSGKRPFSSFCSLSVAASVSSTSGFLKASDRSAHHPARLRLSPNIQTPPRLPPLSPSESLCSPLIPAL